MKRCLARQIFLKSQRSNRQNLFQNFTGVQINISDSHYNNILSGHKCLEVLLMQ